MGVVHQQHRVREHTIDDQPSDPAPSRVTSRVTSSVTVPEGTLAAVTSRVTELEEALRLVTSRVTELEKRDVKQRSGAAERQRRYRERQRSPGT